MLTGILPIGSGTFTLSGEQVAPKNQVDANHHGIAIVVQETGTLSGLTVAENMFLGDEDQFIKNGLKDTRAMNKKAQELPTPTACPTSRPRAPSTCTGL